MSPHPYFPRTLALPNYVPPTYPLSFTLTVVLTVVAVIATVAYILAHLKRLPLVEGMIFTWLVLSGTIHCTLQAYFVLFHQTMASDNFIVAQMWKEYAKCDSRYLTSNKLLWCTEAIMLFLVGPMCFYTGYLVYISSELSYLYLLICSLGHLLLSSVYMLTSILDGSPQCIPQPFYFWLYFVTSNSPWIIFPTMLIIRSVLYLHQVLLQSKAN